MKTLKLAKGLIAALILGLIFSFSFNPTDVAAQNKDKNPPTQQTSTPKKHKKHHRKHHKKHKKTTKTGENKTKENKPGDNKK